MSCDCEVPALYRSKLVTTRKKHKCVECGIIIPLASQAEKVDTLYDGCFQSLYTCLKCQEVIDYIRQYTGEDDMILGLQENLCCHGELYEVLHCAVFDDIDEDQEEGMACYYRPSVSWLNPVVKGRFTLNQEVIS